MSNNLKLKNAFELQELVTSIQNKGENAKENIYQYFDLIHGALLNYQCLIDQMKFSINEHNQNVSSS